MTQPQQYRRKSEVVTAVQFDPEVTPWPEGVTGSEPGFYYWWGTRIWPGEFGLADLDGVTEGVRTAEVFASEYEPVSSGAAAPPEPQHDALKIEWLRQRARECRENAGMPVVKKYPDLATPMTRDAEILEQIAARLAQFGSPGDQR